MLDFLELEETVGKAWHRLVGGAASYPRHPEHAVALEEVRGSLAVFFRGLGGEFGVQIAGIAPRASSHRLRLWQRVGIAEERMEQPGRDAATLFLPPRIELFPSRVLNGALYTWLAAYFAHVSVEPITEADPLRRDLLALRRAKETVSAVLQACPGLAGTYRDLCAAVLRARPPRPLTAVESEVERLVLAMLGSLEARPALWDAMIGESGLPPGPLHYQTFLPVPLWGDAWTRASEMMPREGDDPAGPSDLSAGDDRRRFAARREMDQAQRRDPFILNRFEKILAMAEMVNVNRPSDDSEDENAEKAAD